MGRLIGGQPRCPGWMLALLAGAFCIGLGGRAAAVTPDSPDVKEIVAKAVAFLEASNETGFGQQCLIGLALLKAGVDPTDPKIQQAATNCVNTCHGSPGDGALGMDVYSNGIGVIFLCELDPYKYQAEIYRLLKSLQAKQKPHGGWGYPERQTGDTSMTQYGVLASWEGTKNGFVVPQESIERVANWLLRTQDPTGGWGYQGMDPGPGGGTGNITLVKQTQEVDVGKKPTEALGLSAAGLGSTYICADLLGLTSMAVLEEEDPNLPPALKAVRGDAPNGQNGQKALTQVVDGHVVRAAIDRGNGWWRTNYKIEGTRFPYYYLYALERYESFSEAASGRRIKEPSWYNDGYRLLKKKQLPNGSWDSKGNNIIVPDTAFGILFLVRSTKKSIEKSQSYTASALAGGQGLPADLSQVRVKSGRIVPKPVTGPLATLMDMLSHPEDPKFTDLSDDPQDLVRQLQEEDAGPRGEHLARLRQLAGRGPAETRLASVRVLAAMRDMDSVPTLIHALSESDWHIVVAANEGLQFTSRRVGPEQITEAPDEKARSAAIRVWKSWFASVRPDASSTP